VQGKESIAAPNGAEIVGSSVEDRARGRIAEAHLHLADGVDGELDVVAARLGGRLQPRYLVDELASGVVHLLRCGGRFEPAQDGDYGT
jgi:hypothetical protein